MERLGFSIGGVRLSALTAGHGRPFLFIHGLCGEAAQTIEVSPDIEGWRCISIECRGHGQSDFGDRSDLSIARFTADIMALLPALDGPPPVIGGISMGAAIALRAAAMHPGAFSGLVLARPAWVNEAAPENLAPHRRIAADIALYGADEARRMFEGSTLARTIASEAPDNMTSLLGFFDRRPAEQTQALLEAIAHDGPGISRDTIMTIDIPALVIGTGRDLAHPLAMAQELANLIPSATLVEITAKSDNRTDYVTGFQTALRQFLREIG